MNLVIFKFEARAILCILSVGTEILINHITFSYIIIFGWIRCPRNLAYFFSSVCELEMFLHAIVVRMSLGVYIYNLRNIKDVGISLTYFGPWQTSEEVLKSVAASSRMGKISIEPHTSLCIRFFDNRKQKQNNRLPLGLRPCLIVMGVYGNLFHEWLFKYHKWCFWIRKIFVCSNFKTRFVSIHISNKFARANRHRLGCCWLLQLTQLGIAKKLNYTSRNLVSIWSNSQTSLDYSEIALVSLYNVLWIAENNFATDKI